VRVLVTAEAFGYGPIITGINIIKNLKMKCSVELIFMGSGVALEQAKKSDFFQEYIYAETFNRKDLIAHKDIFLAVDSILSFENVEGAVYGVQLGKMVFYVDNLFWMWDVIPKELERTAGYFIVNTFNVLDNLERIGTNIQNKCLVGPLRNFDVNCDVKIKDRIMVNFGGGESFLIDSQIVIDYYKNILEIIDQCIDEIGVKDVIVCGGSKMIKNLSKEIKLHNYFEFVSFAYDEYLEEMKQSRYLILSPGLGNMYETLSVEREVFFVPPINYSQYWQLEYYKDNGIVSNPLNWGDFGWNANIMRFVEESIGVNQVLDNIKTFLHNHYAKDIVKKRILRYLNDEFNSRSEKKRYLETILKDGIEVTTNEIIRRGGIV